MRNWAVLLSVAHPPSAAVNFGQDRLDWPPSGQVRGPLGNVIAHICVQGRIPLLLLVASAFIIMLAARCQAPVGETVFAFAPRPLVRQPQCPLGRFEPSNYKELRFSIVPTCAAQRPHALLWLCAHWMVAWAKLEADGFVRLVFGYCLVRIDAFFFGDQSGQVVTRVQSPRS